MTRIVRGAWTAEDAKAEDFARMTRAERRAWVERERRELEAQEAEAARRQREEGL